MSPEPTGVHGLLKQRKLFTHKSYSPDMILSVDGITPIGGRKYITQNPNYSHSIISLEHTQLR